MLRTLESLFGPGVDFCGLLIGRLFTHTCKAWNLGKKSCPNHPVVPAIPLCSLPANCCGYHGRRVVTVATERPTGCQSPAPALSQVNRHLLVNPPLCQLQMAPMTPLDTIIWPIFPKVNRPMSRPQKSTPGPNRDSKVPS